MKTRIAVFVPLAVFIIAVGAIFIADRHNRGRNYDLSAVVDEIVTLENGDLKISAHGVFNDIPVDEETADLTGANYIRNEFYEFTVPAKLAKKYDIYENMTLTFDYKEKDGKMVVTKLPKSYKK